MRDPFALTVKCADGGVEEEAGLVRFEVEEMAHLGETKIEHPLESEGASHTTRPSEEAKFQLSAAPRERHADADRLVLFARSGTKANGGALGSFEIAIEDASGGIAGSKHQTRNARVSGDEDRITMPAPYPKFILAAFAFIETPSISRIASVVTTRDEIGTPHGIAFVEPCSLARLLVDDVRSHGGVSARSFCAGHAMRSG